MTDETTASAADDLRSETATASPELADHDAGTTHAAEIEDLKRQLLYAQAETQNVRRRMEKIGRAHV